MTFDYVHTVTGEVVPSEDFDPLERDEVKYQRRARRPSGGSALGDRIIADGPFVVGGEFPEWMAAIKTAAEWNGLRDELIELRARVAPVRITQKVRDAYLTQVRPGGLDECIAAAFRAAGVEVVDAGGDGAAPIAPAALRWQPGEWRGVAPDNQPGTQMVSGTVERADGLHTVSATVYGLPRDARVDLVDGEVRVYQNSAPVKPLARPCPDDVPAMPGPPLTRIDPIEAFEALPFLTQCPRCTSPNVSTRFVVTDGSTDASYCGDRWHDRAGARWVPGDTITPPQWLCPVCYRPMSPGMVECAGCAGADDAAAKRQADQ